MKINLFVSSVLVSLALYACQPDSRDNNTQNENEQVNTEQQTPVKLIEYLVGEWELQNGSGAGQQGNASQRLTFTEEARYIAHSNGQKVDSGAYRMNEQLRNLYLESEADEKPREFEVELQQDVMTLTPTQQQGQGSLTYRRVSGASVPPDKQAQ